MQRRGTFGGGVSPRNTRFRGQSIIECVLIIAVIGLVIVFAGPGVAGAIRNQFNLVGNTLNSGTNGGTEGGGASGGGDTGTASATVQAAVAKDAKDWTLNEQKAVAEDIAAKGEASPAFTKVKAAMDAGTKFSVKLTNGKTMKYRIVDINHDDFADGSGKAGLTFEAANDALDQQRMNATNTNVGGWEASELRGRLNTGDLWSLLPSELQSKVKSVKKMTDNQGGGKAGAPTATTDKVFLLSATSDRLFLLSYSEIAPASHWASGYPWSSSEGTQYEAFRGKVTENYSGNPAIDFGYSWWERLVYPSDTANFLRVYGGNPSSYTGASYGDNVYPAWCF